MTSLSVALGSNSRLPGYNYSVLGVDFWEWQGEAASCVLWMIPSSNPAEYSTACMAGDILDRCMIWEAFHLGYPFGGLTFGLYSYSRPEVDRIWMNMIYIEYGFLNTVIFVRISSNFHIQDFPMFFVKTFAGIEPPEQRRERFAGYEIEKLQVWNVLRPAAGLRCRRRRLFFSWKMGDLVPSRKLT